MGNFSDDKDPYGWFDEHWTIEALKNDPNKTNLKYRMTLYDLKEIVNPEELLEPPYTIIRDGKPFRIITEEDDQLIKKFVENYSKKNFINRIVTLRENKNLCLMVYKDHRKAELLRIDALAVAGTEYNEWWVLDWYQKLRHFDYLVCSVINLLL